MRGDSRGGRRSWRRQRVEENARLDAVIPSGHSRHSLACACTLCLGTAVPQIGAGRSAAGETPWLPRGNFLFGHQENPERGPVKTPRRGESPTTDRDAGEAGGGAVKRLAQ